MNVELHIIQNFSPANLNRDESGAPKDCVFGGVRRARISSQCYKNAVRQYFDLQAVLKGNRAWRTQTIVDHVAKALVKTGKSEEDSKKILTLVFEGLGLKLEADYTTQYMFFIGRKQLDDLVETIGDETNWAALLDAVTKKGAGTKKKELDDQPTSDAAEGASTDASETAATGSAKKRPEKAVSKKKAKADSKKAAAQLIPDDLLVKAQSFLDASTVADIALFGRMIADSASHNVDAACQVAHAISTHAVSGEFDYFTAMDQLSDKPGAGMIGMIQFNSSCYYRYANVDLKQLLENLKGDSVLAKETVDAFIRGFIMAIPKGKQTTMAAQNAPSFVLGVVRPTGFWSLVNAFENPVFPREKKGLIDSSIHALAAYYDAINKAYKPQLVTDAVFAIDSERLPDLFKGNCKADIDTFVTSIIEAIEFTT